MSKLLSKAQGRIFLGAVIVALLFLFHPAVSQAQNGISLGEHSMDYLFASSMRFEAQFTSDAELVDGHLILQIEGVDEVISFPAQIDSTGKFLVEITIADSFTPPAFRTIQYSYLVGSKSGQIFESPRFEFTYEDNRFEWQQLSSEGFTINWHSGGPEFGEALLSAARNSVTSVQRVIPLAGPAEVEFFIYQDQSALLQTMQAAGYNWAAGHSDLSQDRIFLSINSSPSASLEVDRQIPHEMAHLMLFHALGKNRYEQLPKWLDEGIASNAELYSDPTYSQLIELTYAEGTLPSLFSLCENFPQNPSLARVAYAEADAFVAYLRSEYQVVGMGAIVDAYARNSDCMFALEDLLGKNLLQLESDWHQSQFDSQSMLPTDLNQVPWPGVLLALAALVIITWNRFSRRKS